MEIRELRTFVVVAEERSFSRAADRLHVVQSAVSATIRKLEQDLDARLFDRDAHRVELTGAGRVLLPEARRTLAAAAGARDAIEAMRGGLRGTVRLGLMQAQRAPEISVPRLLAEFGRRYPEVELELHQGNSSQYVDDLRAGRLDLAYLVLTSETGRGIKMNTLRDEEMQLVVATDHPLAGRSDVRLPELEDEPFVEGPAGWGARLLVEHAFAKAGASHSTTYVVNDIQSIIQFVQYGLAVSLLPPSVLLPQDEVSTIPIHRHAPRFVTSIGCSADRKLGAAAQILLDTALKFAQGSTSTT